MKPAAVLFLFAALLSAQDPTTRADSRAATPPVASPAEAFPFFARVVKNNVNVRGGPSDAYSPLRQLKTGTVVRVVGREGDWYRAEAPGGLAMWVAVRGGGRDYVKGAESGVGEVVARDLQLRGTPDTKEPPLGELDPGEKIEILEMRGDWAKIRMPAKRAGYLAARMTKAAADPAAAAAEFLEADGKAVEEVRSNSKTLVETIRKQDAEAARTKRAELAFERYSSERRKPAAERDLKGVGDALEAVVKEAPREDDRYAVRAKSLLEDLKAFTALEESVAKAKAAQAEAEKRAKESQITYEKDLEALKRRKEEEAAQREGRNKKYVAIGYVRLAPPLPGALESAPKYALHRGSQREYFLVSDKYQLSDFNGKHVGILEADAPEERPGLPFRVLRVRKLEIISPGPE
jgi:uncharacterized protein YgiM (DUF1202 family)